MLRSGPFSDQAVVGLLNARFVPVYFDLGQGSPAADDEAKAFVVQVKPELGGRSVPTPPVLFMTAAGELVGEISNYASEEEMILALRAVLAEQPELAKPAAGEAEWPRHDRALLAHWLGDDPAARALLEGERTQEESLLLAQIARRAGDAQGAAQALAELDPEGYAAHLSLERGLLAYARGDFPAMAEFLAAHPEDGERAPEARYYLGVAQFHRVQIAAARATWKNLVQRYGENRWSYRADWAHSQTTDDGTGQPRRAFTTSGPKSLLGRHGYMGRRNPDLVPR